MKNQFTNPEQNLKKHYNQLYSESIKKVKSTNFQVDKLIDSKTDNRYGITLLIRPSTKIKNKFQKFLNELKKIEPDQYYYRNSDIHITVMSIISCYNGFNLTHIDVNDYVNIISKSIEGEMCFDIDFTGVTSSQSAIMIQGFLNESTLNLIRDNLRNSFKISNLEQSLDKRYSIQTAHSTVVRFRKAVKNKNEFIEVLEKYRNYKFGSFTVNKMELVGNDWYQRKEFVKKLRVFELKQKLEK